MSINHCREKYRWIYSFVDRITYWEYFHGVSTRCAKNLKPPPIFFNTIFSTNTLKFTMRPLFWKKIFRLRCQISRKTLSCAKYLKPRPINNLQWLFWNLQYKFHIENYSVDIIIFIIVKSNSSSGWDLE